MGKIIGIDLGTTNSVAAVMQGRRPTVIPNSLGERLTPSVVAFDEKNRRLLVGTPAKRQSVTNPQNTVFSVKRFLGRRADDPAIEHDLRLCPSKIRREPNGGISVWMSGKWCPPQDVLAVILQDIKRDAEALLGEPVKGAVITVPSCFNHCQRQAARDAGRIAGLDALRIINESTAACLAFGFGRGADETVAVYHLGGGTFDVSILDIGNGVFEVRSTGGDTHLGGDDWDQRIVDAAADEFLSRTNIDLRKDPQALQRLREAGETAKIELSTAMEATVDLPYVASGSEGPVHLHTMFTRAGFDRLTGDLVDRTIEACRRALEDAGIKPGGVDRVVLVGQQTRMPAVQKAVSGFFGKAPCREVDPAEVVALGAAVLGGVLAGEVRGNVLLDVTPFNLSVETKGGVASTLIKRNTPIPYRCQKTFSTAADGQTSVDIKVYQGDQPATADNVLLGHFRMEGIAPAPKGVPLIEVTFDIAADDVITVSAADRASGREHKVVIVSPGDRLAPAGFGKRPRPVKPS